MPRLRCAVGHCAIASFRGRPELVGFYALCVATAHAIGERSVGLQTDGKVAVPLPNAAWKMLPESDFSQTAGQEPLACRGVLDESHALADGKCK